MSKHLKKDVLARLNALKNGNQPNGTEQGQGAQEASKVHMPGPTQARTLKQHQNRGSSGK